MAEKHDWSPFQKKIFYNIAKESGHLIVEARAGSGKSTSLIESIRYVPKGKSVIALAFNKSIASHLSEKCSSFILTKTFHSFGLMAVKQKFPNIAVDNNKVIDIIKKIPQCENEKGKPDWNLIFSLADTVSYCKMYLNDTPSFIDEIMYQFNVDTCEVDRKEFISLVIKILGKDKEDTTKIDFDGMCYFPFAHNLNVQMADYVFLDEYQDLNYSQLYLAKKACKSNGGRIIAYGDSKQDLYSWRGSDSSIIKGLKEESTTQILSLPISYRCPKKIIELCQKWVPDITCPDIAIDGEIHEIMLDKLFDTAQSGCFVLSRTNAPLISVCLGFISKGKKASIRGKDIGLNLKSIIKKSKKKRIDAFLKWIEKWKEQELEKIKGKRAKPEEIIDKYECLINLCDNAKDLNEVSKKIDDLFSDSEEKNMIMCSTSHRAKGLERDDVFILKWTYWKWLDNIPYDHESLEDEELNIAYVSCSRARKNLYLVKKPK